MSKDDILRLARKRMDEAYSAELDQREMAENDLRFLTGDQWPEDVRLEREADGKPCLTFNGMSQYVRQVTGQIRNLNPAIKVLPAEENASDDVAEIYEGLIRQIEYKADASSIYEGAAQSAAACGIGHWRIRADYEPGLTFNQELLIEPIYNPFSVFTDPFAKHPTRCDARYRFIVSEMEMSEFKDTYPEAQIGDITSEHRLDFIEHWRTANSVVVAEYFWIEYEDVRIALMGDGSILKNPPKGVQFAKERTVKEPRVKWAKINGAEVLEGPKDIPCRYIPVVTVTGEEWHLGEETYISGVIRHAKDAQQLYNFARSANAEVIALQPKAPYMLTAKQIAGEGVAALWQNANRTNNPYLLYTPDPAAPGAPQRVQPPVPSSALLTEIQLAAEDMKRTTGIYDASLGAKSNETSGVAIRQRQSEAQNGTSVYADNMVKGVVVTGKILVDMIPKIYDTQRTIRILGPNGQEKQAVINQMMTDQNGQMTVNDMTSGRYDVRITVGPAYATRKQEAAEGMLEFAAKVPAAQAAADIIAEMQEWPEADRVAKRIKKTLPPNLLDDDEQEQPDPAQMQAKQAAMQQEQAQAQMMMRKAEADIREAEAKAAKAEAEAQKATIEVAQMTGQIDAIIQQQVQAAVANTVAQLMQAQPAPQMPGYPA